MLTQSHGHIYVVVALCLLTLLFVLEVRYGSHLFSLNQYTRSGKADSNSIKNATLGFEKIFVINGPWRTDRKDSISLAASYSGITLDWINGVESEDIREAAFPPGNHRQINHGNIGSWRAHMNAIREIIEKNLTTALILEDDADWDFRIRDQLSEFSRAARKIPELVYLADMHAPRHPPSFEDKRPDPVNLAKRSTQPLPILNSRDIPQSEPYGRDWDVLWLGHCGAELPPPSVVHPNRLMTLNDETVPAPKHLKPATQAPQDAFAPIYPPHTRLYHRTSKSTLCTLAYAVTQTGARKILFQHGIRDFSKGYDFALSDYCNGLTKNVMKGNDGKGIQPMCVTVQPPLFSHFWGERGGSDIMGIGAGGRMEVGSRYLKRSVRSNLEGLVRGREMEGVVEQWADEDYKKV